MAADYSAFLASKAIAPAPVGITVVPSLASHLRRFQREAVAFGLQHGRWGCFFDTGLGKTAIELEWCHHAAAATNGRALILTPLAVARQIEAEGIRWGYQIRVVRSTSDVGEGINVCNYDRLHLLDVDAFGAVALDEASILKNFTGKVSQSLIEAFAGHRFKLVATATPAPNDHMELGQYCAFLSVMSSHEMLMRWFTADQTTMGTYRLKGHGAESFWDWMASWSRMAEHPRDLGDDVDGYTLPPMVVHRHHAVEPDTPSGDGLFGGILTATNLHEVKRATVAARADVVATLVDSESDEPWIVWCDTDYEADALLKALPGSLDVRGSHSIEVKEARLSDFAAGRQRVLISKPSVCGFGLNWQFCARVAFVGRSFSYETWYQAVRRCWRFGQARSVDVHLVVAEGEDTIGRVIDRKAGDHAAMKREMTAAMRRATAIGASLKVAYQPTHIGRAPSFLEDSCPSCV